MDDISRSTGNDQEPVSIPTHKRIMWWIVAWGIAGFAMLPMIGFVFWFWLFPVGMFEPIVPKEFYRQCISGKGPSPLIFGWLVYIILTSIGLQLKVRSHYRCALALLYVVLILNVTGCYHGFSKMHFE